MNAARAGRMLFWMAVLFGGFLIYKRVSIDTNVSRTDGWESTARNRRKDPPPSLV